MAAQGRSQLARQIVGAAMAAKEGHDFRPVLRNSKDRRLVALVGNERCENADEDA
jgi:hypothetical protein